MIKKRGSTYGARPRRGFTIAETMVVFLLLVIILIATYKVFFSQAKMVGNAVEMLKVNDHFRRIQVHLGNDIREATWILLPHPVKLEDTPRLVTPQAPCKVLHLVKQEVDPTAKYQDAISANPTATDTYGQIVRVREIVYELRPFKKKDDDEEPAPNTAVPRFRLIRTELVKERDTLSQTMVQEVEITDTIRDFVLFRTTRKPMRALDVAKTDDHLLELLPSYETGTGNNVIHVRLALERFREGKTGEVYDINMETSFYKRGKEVFFHQ